jgi:hypothetical protein
LQNFLSGLLFVCSDLLLPRFGSKSGKTASLFQRLQFGQRALSSRASALRPPSQHPVGATTMIMLQRDDYVTTR